MAKHRYQHMRKIQTMRLLLLAVLALGVGVSSIWADQLTPTKTTRTTATTQTTGQKPARSTPAKAGKTSAQRKSKSATTQLSASTGGKRDPFKLPLAPGGKNALGETVMESAPGGVLPPGVRGLLISQLKLEGVVRQQTANKMIAVVTNETKRAYFLTENESVYNGVVSKITPDAVYFKENVLDSNGRVTTREVVKRLNPAPGEGR